MSKLIINGDTWGEFTGSTKKKDGNIEIRGYRSYDTLHTVRVMDHPDGLNRNQQIVLDVLKKNANQGIDELIVGGITYLNDEEIDAIELSSQTDLYEVLSVFAAWGQSEVQNEEQKL